MDQDYTAWTDHEPLLSIYNNLQKPITKRIARHQNNLRFRVKYLKGDRMPCDYGSRYAKPTNQPMQQEQERLGFHVGNDVYVRKMIILGNSPNVLEKYQLGKAAFLNPKYQQLIMAVNNRPPESNINQKIFAELYTDNSLILCGNKTIPLDVPEHAGRINVDIKMLDIAHERHPGENAKKRYARSRLWFPKMDEEISKITQGWLAYQASTVTKTRYQFIASYPPAELRQNLAADHWDSTDGYLLLVVTDELSQYLEVEVKGTGAEGNIEAFENIFS